MQFKKYNTYDKYEEFILEEITDDYGRIGEWIDTKLTLYIGKYLNYEKADYEYGKEFKNIKIKRNQNRSMSFMTQDNVIVLVLMNDDIEEIRVLEDEDSRQMYDFIIINAKYDDVNYCLMDDNLHKCGLIHRTYCHDRFGFECDSDDCRFRKSKESYENRIKNVRPGFGSDEELEEMHREHEILYDNLNM